MFLALKEIKKEKTRFAMIILVTALIAFLIYFLSALAFGLAELNKTAVKYWDAKGVVLSEAANKNIYSSNFDVEKLKDLGISSDNTINLASASVYVNDRDDPDQLIDLVFMGVTDDNENLTAPIVEGRKIENDHEIAISNNLKNDTDIKLGDTVKNASTNREFKVVGFTEDSNYNVVPVGYVTRDMASQAMMLYKTDDPEVDAMATPTPNMPTNVSALVVKDDLDPSALDGSDLEYVGIEDFIDNIPGYTEQILTFGLMIIALAVISAIIIGIFMYILTMQKKPIFGVLKIQGYRNSVIVKSVVYQTLILVLAGFVIGLLVTFISIHFLEKTVPLAVSPKIYLAVTGFSILCSLIGSLFSVNTILKIDPLEAI